MADIFLTTFSNPFSGMNVWILIKISLKFVPKGPINNIPALVQIMAWHRQGDKPLSEPMLVSFQTYLCVIRPQWVKPVSSYISKHANTHSHTCASFVTRNWSIAQSDWPSVMHCLSPKLAYSKHSNTKEVLFLQFHSKVVYLIILCGPMYQKLLINQEIPKWVIFHCLDLYLWYQ